MRRRRYLALLGAGGLSGLAGCAGGNGGGDGTTSTDTSTETGTATGTPTEQTTTGTGTATSTRTGTETATGTPTESTATGSGAETTGGSSGETTSQTTGSDGSGESAGRTVEVGPGGRYVFEPGTDTPLEIPVGTTVEWVWRSDTHNVVVDSQPAEANWEGTSGGTSSVYDAGYTYTHTFETEGKYRYYCHPHRSLGMVADVVVTGGR